MTMTWPYQVVTRMCFLRVCSLTRTHLNQESTLSKDVAKFIKSLQIPKQQSQWVVEDEDTSRSERCSSEDNEKTDDTPPVVSVVAPAEGKASKYVCTKYERASLNSNPFCTVLSSNFPLVSVLPPLPPCTSLQAPSERIITSISAQAEALLKPGVRHYSHFRRRILIQNFDLWNTQRSATRLDSDGQIKSLAQPEGTSELSVNGKEEESERKPEGSSCDRRLVGRRRKP